MKMAGKNPGHFFVDAIEAFSIVMRGLDPRIHHASQRVFRRRWIARSSRQ
jgi:hypothetical protein